MGLLGGGGGLVLLGAGRVGGVGFGVLWGGSLVCRCWAGGGGGE